MASVKKLRIDLLLVERGLAESRNKAQALVLAGQVLVAEERVDKPGTTVPKDAVLRLKQQDPYVSRGGHKLAGALATLEISPTGLTCADLGASTGGFTDCLLQQGALKVFAVDVGYGLLAHKLTRDSRVAVMERTNARHLRRDSFDEAIDLVVVDASFISITKFLDALSSILAPGKHLLAMIKPQFEVGRELASKYQGVIADPDVRRKAITDTIAQIETAGFESLAGCDSGVAGPKGNVEYFVYCQRRQLNG